MALVYFPVTGTYKAVTSDTSSDPDGTPNIQNISSFVYFDPSAKQVRNTTDNTTYELATIRARTNPDLGEIVNIDGTAVTLVANTADLDVEELTYKVTFTNVVYGEAEQEIDAFRFVAPTDDTPVDLTSVDRLPA